VRTIAILLLVAAFSLAPLAQARDAVSPTAPAGWGAPGQISGAGWPELRYFSLSDDAARLVGVDPWNSSDDHSHNVLASEFVGGAWQPPAVIAQNGVYATGSFIWMPQWTHPVISGDGNTIVYLGWTGTTNGVYVVDRLPGGGWSAPALVNTGLGNTHYWISLSQDGKTLALASYSFMGVDHVYVTTRAGGVWSALVRVSAASGPLEGGGNPSLSADGRKLVYIQNARATFTELIDGQWTAPIHLTTNNHWEGYMVEYPQISGDGRAVIYWLVHNVGGTLTSQDLYVLRRAGGVWAAPEKVNSSANVPITDVSRAPAAANREATRLIYARAIATGDTVHSSDLQISEWREGAWHEAQLVATDGWTYNRWPRLTPDGVTLTFQGLSSHIWQMTTDTPPAPRPLPTSVAAQIGPAGGALFSEIDQTGYLFGPGTFTETITFTHSVPPGPPPAPPGLIGIPGIGGLGRGFEATALGPGGLPFQPTMPVTITVDYSALGRGAAISGTLGLWRLDGAAWKPLPGVDDAVAGRLTAAADHFSRFAVFGATNRIFLPLLRRP
jgi:hypothetical protein